MLTLFLFIHWLSEHLQSSCVSLHFNDKLSHFKRQQNQLRTSHSGLDWFILNAAHCVQDEEEMGHNLCEPVICYLISIAGHILFPLKTPVCLCCGGNPFLQIGYETLCHSMTCSPLDVLPLIENFGPVHLLHLLLSHFPVAFPF